MIIANDASTKARCLRVEIFTGTGRRRTWLHEEKVRIVAEIASSGDSVCAIARRHGLSPQQLFGWRRQLRDAVADTAEIEVEGLEFVAGGCGCGIRLRFASGCGRQSKRGITGAIEVEIDGVTIRSAAARMQRLSRRCWVR